MYIPQIKVLIILLLQAACVNTFSLETKTSVSSSSSSSFSSKLTRTGADMDAWRNGFTCCPKELPPSIVSIDLPPDFPVGTYYRNGHARFRADDGTPVLHPFDGDGMIVAMTFDPDNKRMLFRNKFVETESYLEDKRTGTMSKRGLFGTRRSGGFLQNVFRTDYKHVANTSVLHAGDSLYALWEGGLPYLLDPLTLRNKNGPGKRGQTDLDGLIENTFSAHYRYDPIQKTYVNFGNFFDPFAGTKVTLFELDEDTFRSKRRPTATPPSITLDENAPSLLHDFVLTENYCIFNINKTEMNNDAALKAILGGCGFAGVIDVDSTVDTTKIVLVPRSLFDEAEPNNIENINIREDERIIVVPVPNHFNFHYGNCFEDEDGDIVFDTVQSWELDLSSVTSFEQPIWEVDDPFANVVPTSLVRYTIDLKTHELSTVKPPQTAVSTRNPEFPSFPKILSTRKHRYLYPAVTHEEQADSLDPRRKGAGVLGGLSKVDMENPAFNEFYSFESYEFVGEAVLCPKVGKDINKEEDACYLIVNVVNGRDKTTDLCVFDVEGKGTLSKGPILRQQLPVILPHMLHGSFADSVTFDFDAFER